MDSENDGARSADSAPKGRTLTADDWTILFLSTLAETGNISASCRKADIDRQTFYNRRRKDKKFARAAKHALRHAADVVEMSVRMRAVYGVPRKKFTQSGDPIMDPETGRQYVEMHYSDGLALELLRAHSPKFRKAVKVEHGGKGGGPIVVEVLRGVSMDDL